MPTKNKTTETTKSVAAFLKKVTDPARHVDCLKIQEIMEEQSGFEAKMWGPAIVGFGSLHYKYETGREGDMPLIAFSPRAAALVLYLSGKFENRDELLAKLGKHKTGKGCLYIKRLEDVDITILKKMISATIKQRTK